jgi:hypothetical protein
MYPVSFPISANVLGMVQGSLLYLLCVREHIDKSQSTQKRRTDGIGDRVEVGLGPVETQC